MCEGSQQLDQTKKLFTGEDGWFNAYINSDAPEWYLYAEGYRRAADVVVGHVLETHRSHNFLVYPVVFLYRHHVELCLKHLIIEASCLTDKEVPSLRTHDLAKLWKTCRSLFCEAFGGDFENDLQEVDWCIGQLVETDPGATAFKYPTSKDGKPSLPKVTSVNLKRLSEVMDRVASLLDAAKTCIDVETDAKSEMYQAMASHYGHPSDRHRAR